MKKILALTTVLLLSATTTQTFAQSQEDMQKMMDYMKPGDMHKMLAGSTGKWKEEMTMWTAPGVEPMKMEITCEMKMILNGMYLEAVSSGNFGGMPFEGRNVVGYDNIRKIFQSTWVDNMGSGITYFEGPYDEATKTVTFAGKMVEPSEGREIEVKETMQFVDENTQVMTMYKIADGKEVKMMQIKLTRQS
ncbi:DUF1579 domain-containing protein [Panacibacter sp. DH6]|uniref:DUF1579 domain-containing protein n=1 Tax=Panacibacter microcysteis TaxID=2793269 RepID=A0A931GXC1_9BACT|nr:DUF1579 domain-containing protein [Panacibacter microcysteis]MBG9375374.1 DUF1579 domain-containing protein [Panacibacter microcysteis]